MNVFNSLGSNYDGKFVLQSLFATKRESLKNDLKVFLSKKYGADTILFYKGREAIELALRLSDLPKDSKVVITGFTCYAVSKAVTSAGCSTYLLDIDPQTLNFTPKALKIAVKRNPDLKAVIVQNTLGYSCDIEEIEKICQENNLILIEDLAHSLGSFYKNGKEAGSVGDFAVLSFSQDKIVDGISGGALIIRNKKFQKKQKISFNNIDSKQQTRDRLYPLFTFLIRTTYPIMVGKVFHLILKKTDFLTRPMSEGFYGLFEISSRYCGLILSAFSRLEADLSHRRKVAKIYKNNINKKIVSRKIVQLIDRSTNLRFPIFVANRQKLILYLKKKGVYLSDIWYDAPIAPKRYLAAVKYERNCPNSEMVASQIINLPTHRKVSSKIALKISKLINQWLKSQ